MPADLEKKCPMCLIRSLFQNTFLKRHTNFETSDLTKEIAGVKVHGDRKTREDHFRKEALP